MVPSQKRVKNRPRKWYHFRKGSNIVNKTYHFSQIRVKIPQQKWYHLRRGSKIVNKNGTIPEKGQKLSTKMVPFKKVAKIPIKLFSPLKSHKIKPTLADFQFSYSSSSGLGVAPHASNASITTVSPILVHGAGMILAWYILLFCSFYNLFITTLRVAAEIYIPILIN